MSGDLQLSGFRALVSGGTKGVGEAVVARLREAGVKVLTTARSRGELSGDGCLLRPTSPAPKAARQLPMLSAGALAALTSLSMSSAAHPRRLAGSRC